MSCPTDRREHRLAALEQLALDAIGCLSTDEGWVREHLEARCEICCAAAEQVNGLFDEMLLAVPPVQPPPALRERVLARVRGAARRQEDLNSVDEAQESRTGHAEKQLWNKWTSSGAPRFHTLPASHFAWEETDIAGISACPLHVDEERDQVTMLIRMAPGTAYPSHRHAGDEQCYVIQGDLSVGNEVLRAGDFQFAPADSIHGVQSTEDGCLLLIVSSRNDEILST